MSGEFSDLREAHCKHINGCLGCVLLVIVNAGDFAKRWGAPCLSCKEPGEYTTITDLAEAIGAEMDECIKLRLVKGEDVLGSECGTINGDVEDVNG